MFAKPRAKKSILPHPSKRRKNTSEIEEIAFDNDARQEFLTGFHKRKLQRIKHAQDVAAKRARQEKLEARKQIRDERKKELEEHIQTVTQLLRKSQASVGKVDQPTEDGDDQEWDGFVDQPSHDLVDVEEEYIDEDRYTTVTIESVSVTRDGLNKPETLAEAIESEAMEEASSKDVQDSPTDDSKRKWPEKKKKKKFRYESKTDRAMTNAKQRIRRRP